MQKAILATLIYADIFDYPLKKEEIWEWLVEIGENRKTKKQKDLPAGRQARKTFDIDLDFLLKSKKIGQKDNYFFLHGRSGLVEIRRKREVWSAKKIRRAENVAGILRKIPWISLIGLTGALSRNNAKRGDDIDLFFVVAKNRLWLTRGLVVVILRILGLYRETNKVADMICPNMFVSENVLKMGPQDLFIAHEVYLMRPLFIQDDAYLKFLQANLWAKKFLPNAGVSKNYDVKSKTNRSCFQILPFTFYFLDLVEGLAKKTQLWYMRKRRTTETVSDDLIKFHPQDVRVQVLENWKKKRPIFFASFCL